MRRSFFSALLALAWIAALTAQAPSGWKVRIDRSATASDPDAAGPVKFVATASGFHATNPIAAVFWKPGNTATANYTLKGTFVQIRPSPHVNYYGLIFGGRDLDGPAQSYLYFVVAQDGTWLLKRRDGGSTRNLTTYTPNGAIKKLDASGKSTNALEVRVTADKIEYVVNGTVVHTTPKTGPTANTDGAYGIRINHLLEVEVQGFGVSK
jgi:hypothetical protein